MRINQKTNMRVNYMLIETMKLIKHFLQGKYNSNNIKDTVNKYS